MVLESHEIHFFFRFVIRISISLVISMLNCAFTHMFFTAHTSLGCRKCLMGMLCDHMLSRTPYRTCVAVHVILKVREEDAILMHYLCHYQIIESQQADWHIKQNVIAHQS